MLFLICNKYIADLMSLQEKFSKHSKQKGEFSDFIKDI